MVREMSELLFEFTSRSRRLRAVGRGRFGNVRGLALRDDWFEFEFWERNFGSASPEGSLGLRLKVLLCGVSLVPVSFGMVEVRGFAIAFIQRIVI